MNKEELEDLLSIGCCKYHEEIGEKAKKEIERLNKQVNEALIVCNDRQKEIQRLNNIIKDIKDYINFLVIYNQTISGKFSETQWGQDILGLIGSDK